MWGFKGASQLPSTHSAMPKWAVQFFFFFFMAQRRASVAVVGVYACLHDGELWQRAVVG